MTTTTKRTFDVPARAEVSANNQQVFDSLQKGLGFVPNLYAYFAKSETALADYLTFQNRKSTLKAKEREVINLVVSQVNGCRYCLSAHTVLGKMNGFTDEQIIDLRNGSAGFDSKIDVLVKLAKSITVNRGRADEALVESFFEAGYTEANLVDLVIVIGDKIISNYIHNLTGFEIDFPLAEKI
ncbi:MAG: carboxymuconolactone decarboxylase family protein [Sphingobacteriaceae bacterium]|nr:carboxymuconolactone decarboxylase family protein [Flavobacteriaceae bacterium]MBY0542362.1 carboxymuconolactone decarboxylase family protein [Sphingobacteriaceae bacterium]